LVICCHYNDEEPYFRNDGTIEKGFMDTDLGHLRIVQVGSQRLKDCPRFEIDNPVAGVEMRTDGDTVTWRTTVAGGGTYLISKEDCDKGLEVELRDGRRVRLEEWDDSYADECWPVIYEGDCVSLRGYASAREGQLDNPPTTDADIVKVFNPTTKWSTPRAGGGSYEITSLDVGKEVESRAGYKGRIEEFSEPSEYAVSVKWTTPNGPFTDAVRRSGHSGILSESKMPSDIIRVYHS
jgi:hypothetical protein